MKPTMTRPTSKPERDRDRKEDVEDRRPTREVGNEGGSHGDRVEIQRERLPDRGSEATETVEP